MLKELFQTIGVPCMSNLERPAFEEAAIGTEDVAVGVEVQEIPEGQFVRLALLINDGQGTSVPSRISLFHSPPLV
jgi:hypothetical protein